MHRPVFYDATGRRRRLTLPALFCLIIVILAAGMAFAYTIINVPIPPAVPLQMERRRPEGIGQRLNHFQASVRHRLSEWLPHRGPGADGKAVSVAFYVPWDDASRASLRQHIGQIDWVAPTLLSVTGPRHDLRVTNDPVFTSLIRTSAHRPRVMPVVQNADDGDWDGAGTSALLHDRAARKALLLRLAQSLKALKASGVIFDLEALPPSAHADYLSFLKEAGQLLHSQNQQVMLTVPVDDARWNLRAYARVADRLFLMDYDQHFIGDQPGPIAAQPWFVGRLRAALRAVPASKAIVAIGNYAYDWKQGGGPASIL